MYCHTIPNFKLKEASPDNAREYSTTDMKVRDNKAYLTITNIDSDQVMKFFDYVSWHPDIKYVIFELFSPGGYMFDAWRIVGFMDLYKDKGYIIETRTYGFAASAGFLVFANGSAGHRFASSTAEMMWHELITFKLFDISGPADKEDEAKVLRHLQDTANNWLVKHSKLGKAEWDKKIRKKEFWMNGKEAIEYGISDGIPK